MRLLLRAFNGRRFCVPARPRESRNAFFNPRIIFGFFIGIQAVFGYNETKSG